MEIHDKEQIRNIVISRIDMEEELTNEKLHEIINDVVFNISDFKYISLKDKWNLHKDIFDSIKGLGALQELLDDNDITEIMVNDIHNIFIEKNGTIRKHKGSFQSEERLGDIIQQIVGITDKRVNQSSPIVDTRLPDGSRVNVVLPPVAVNGAAVTIRKFPKEKITIDELVKWESITKEAADYLEKLVVSGYNIFISGGTSSGKTTFLNVLSEYIPNDERVITIEDSAELQLHKVKNIVRMEARQENTEGNNAIPIRQLIKTALRMRPDRIIVGEVRGEETLDMLQAMNTGHNGSMSTGHGNSPIDMMNRLETMVLMGIEIPLQAIRAQIASGIDIIVHLGRMRDKSRRVLEISEIIGVEKGEIQIQSLFIFQEKGECKGKVIGKLERTEFKILNVDKLVSSGTTL